MRRAARAAAGRVVNDHGEIWTFLNYAVRVVKNVTYEIEGRQ